MNLKLFLGYFWWEDNSAVDFTNWINEKQITNDEENCASVMPQSLNWTNHECILSNK
jgi:hypothetical protein